MPSSSYLALQRIANFNISLIKQGGNEPYWKYLVELQQKLKAILAYNAEGALSKESSNDDIRQHLKQQDITFETIEWHIAYLNNTFYKRIQDLVYITQPYKELTYALFSLQEVCATTVQQQANHIISHLGIEFFHISHGIAGQIIDQLLITDGSVLRIDKQLLDVASIMLEKAKKDIFAIIGSVSDTDRKALNVELKRIYQHIKHLKECVSLLPHLNQSQRAYIKQQLSKIVGNKRVTFCLPKNNEQNLKTDVTSHSSLSSTSSSSISNNNLHSSYPIHGFLKKFKVLLPSTKITPVTQQHGIK